MEVARSSRDKQQIMSEILEALTSLTDRNNKRASRRVSFPLNVVLQQAITAGNLEELKHVVCSQGTAALNLCDSTGSPLLLRAVREQQLECLEFLVEAGADLTATDENSWTALHMAVRSDNIKTVELLLKCKPELLEERNSDGLRPINVCKSSLLATFLLQAELRLLKANHNDRKKRSRKSCLSYKKTEELRLLQLVMSSPSKDDSNKVQEETALLRQCAFYLAAARNYLGLAYYMMENRLATPDMQDDNCWSAVHLAAMFGSVDVLALLLKCGASSDLRTKDGCLPLDLTTHDAAITLLQKL